MRETSHYLSSFERFENDPGRKGPSWLDPVRKAAIERFSQLGFPTTHDEEWRFTSVDPIERVRFELPHRERLDGAAALAAKASLGVTTRLRLAFVNGRFSRDLSALGSLPAGVRLGSLASAFETDREKVEGSLGRYAPYDTHAFRALNTAFMEDGAFLLVPESVRIEEPVLLLFLSTPQADAALSHPRNLIIAGEGSQLTVIESYAGTGSGVYFTNAVTEVIAENGAIVDHYKLQQEAENAFHIATVQARLAAGSVFSSHSISLGGAIVRNDVGALLDGEGADCLLNGLYLTGGRQHVDNHTTIDHAKAHGTSREVYKGILGGNSRGVFDGKIVVRQDAQKTDARQSNRNLLLSDGALINTKPQLEIRADDVKCAHAATIGRLDETSLFYLRSRGLDLEAARHLLIRAFASEVIDRIKVDSVRAHLEHTVNGLLSEESRRTEAR